MPVSEPITAPGEAPGPPPVGEWTMRDLPDSHQMTPPQERNGKECKSQPIWEMSSRCVPTVLGNMNTEVIKCRRYPQGSHFPQGSSFFLPDPFNNFINCFTSFGKCYSRLEPSGFYFKDFWDLGVSVSELYSGRIPDHLGSPQSLWEQKHFRSETRLAHYGWESHITGKARGSLY